MLSPLSSPQPPDTAARPLQFRTSPEVEALVRRERIDEEHERVALAYLGCERLLGGEEALGSLRAALAWDRLAPHLEVEGWQVDGCLGFNRRDCVEAAKFGNLRLSETLSLEVPRRVILFLRRGAERLVVRLLELEQMRGGTMFQFGAMGAGESGLDFLERWLAYARATNRLRGSALAAGGRLLEIEPGSTNQVFLCPEARTRIDRALARFAGSARARLAAAGVRARGGLILAGPPGTGKSTLGRELAADATATFVWATPGDLTSPEEVAELFAMARWLAPTILFLEDLDLIAESRERGGRASVLGQLMNELDGLRGDHPLLAIATTNRLEVIEEALRNRPGRFDEVVELGLPGVEVRERMLRHFFRGCRLEPRDLAWLNDRLDEASGAEIERLAQEAIALAVLEEQESEGPPEVRRAHLESALEPREGQGVRRTVGFAAV